MGCDTCFKECPFYKRRESCHNHVVTAWKNDHGETMLVHDCAPRRALQMMLATDQQMLGLRQEVQRLQHSVSELAKSIAMFASSVKQIE